MAIDLHTHSWVSDGTESPAALMRAAARAGLSVVALTDHDTTAGWAEAAAAVAGTGVALVRGTEISCTAGRVSVHLLSYLHDPDHAELAGTLDRSRRFRGTRARTMVERINADYPLTWEQVQTQATDGATIGRPHIADALVVAGYAPDRTAAFDTILAASGPYYVRYDAPDAADAVRMVRAAGGVPVFAHPRAAMRGRIVSDDVIAHLASVGLAGLEVAHRDHTPRDQDHLKILAGQLGLFTTGSSDYHGSGKPNRLGEHTTDPEVYAQIVDAGALPVVTP